MPERKVGELKDLIAASGEPEQRLDRLCVQVSKIVEQELGIVIPPERERFIRNRLMQGGHDPAGSTLGDQTPLSEAELKGLAALFCTHETSFFREDAHFRFLREVAVPDLLQSATPRPIRGWSAACSSGEEAYTMAITLAEAIAPRRDWRVEVLATDVSEAILERARKGDWPDSQANRFSLTQLKRYMRKGTGPFAGRMRANERLKRMVRFEQMNLTKPPYPVDGAFDVIFCRNVLIYFRPEVQSQVVRQLTVWLRPGGYLFTGLNEGLGSRNGQLEQVAPSIYRRS